MTWPQALILILLPAAGYFLGSIPFAWIIGKWHGVDIRTTGSKNIGATNLGRTLGARFFWQAFLLDAAKGFFPVLASALLTRHFNSPAAAAASAVPQWSPLLTAGGCFLGHVFPVYLKFKGGKGVATSFGAVLGFWPLFTLAGLIGGAVFVFVLLIYRFISLASVVAAIAFGTFVAVFSIRDLGPISTALSPHEPHPADRRRRFFFRGHHLPPPSQHPQAAQRYRIQGRPEGNR